MGTASNSETVEAVSGAALRTVMRQVPAPVTVVTGCAEEGGPPFGITIGSFTSVSLEPPLVSFNVSEEANAYEWLAAAECFAVHVLRRRQAPLAVRFADPGLPPAQQFEDVSWRAGPGGVPILEGVLAVLHCRPHARFPAGDSDLVVGRVTAVDAAADDAAPSADPKGAVPGAKPLLYHRGGYRSVEAGSAEAEERSEAKRSASRASETPVPKSAKS